LKQKNGNKLETLFENPNIKIKKNEWYNCRIDLREDTVVIWFNRLKDSPEELFAEGGVKIPEVEWSKDFSNDIYTFGFTTQKAQVCFDKFEMRPYSDLPIEASQ